MSSNGRDNRSAPWAISRLEPRLGSIHIQVLCVAASALEIDRQQLEKARDTRSLSSLYSLLKAKLGTHGRALALIVWMLQKTGYNDLADLTGSSDYERIDSDELARDFRPVDFLLTVISIFRGISEEQYERLRDVVAEAHLDGISHDRIESRTSLVQLMYDKELIGEENCDLLYRLLKHHGLDRFCGMLDGYFGRRLTSPLRNSQGKN